MRIAFFLSLLLAVPAAFASNAFRYKGPDGTVLFTDIRPGSGQTRQYKFLGGAAKSASTARSSCSGMTAHRLELRAASFEAAIHRLAAKHGVNPLLIKAIARVESCFDTHAVSTAGAGGLMQLMPETAGSYGLYDLFDAEKNIEVGVRYFAELYRQFEYNHTLALAAYNAGPGAVVRYQGVPPFPETQSYVKKVIGHYREYLATTDP